MFMKIPALENLRKGKHTQSPPSNPFFPTLGLAALTQRSSLSAVSTQI
jgi:hypothetical protein